MNARSFLLALIAAPVFLACLVAHADVAPVPAPPPPGAYSGTVRVTQESVMDELAVTTILRVVARVTPTGYITLLTATPQPPKAAANVDASITQLAPDEKGHYLTGDKIPVTVTHFRGLLSISYQDPPITGVVTGIFPTKFATFQFTLRRKSNAK